MEYLQLVLTQQYHLYHPQMEVEEDTTYGILLARMNYSAQLSEVLTYIVFGCK